VLVVSDLSPKTIQKHVDNLWALGGEIIRDLDDRIDEEGGPLVCALPEALPLTQPIAALDPAKSPTDSPDDGKKERTISAQFHAGLFQNGHIESSGRTISSQLTGIESYRWPDWTNNSSAISSVNSSGSAARCCRAGGKE
jgi:hypothetical protein